MICFVLSFDALWELLNLSPCKMYKKKHTLLWLETRCYRVKGQLHYAFKKRSHGILDRQHKNEAAKGAGAGAGLCRNVLWIQKQDCTTVSKPGHGHVPSPTWVVFTLHNTANHWNIHFGGVGFVVDCITWWNSSSVAVLTELIIWLYTSSHLFTETIRLLHLISISAMRSSEWVHILKLLMMTQAKKQNKKQSILDKTQKREWIRLLTFSFSSFHRQHSLFNDGLKMKIPFCQVHFTFHFISLRFLWITCWVPKHHVTAHFLVYCLLAAARLYFVQRGV